MAGSDVVAVFITADTNAADVASISANERPNTDFTIGGTDTSGGVATFDAGRIVTATTTGTGDSANSLRPLPQRVPVHNQRLMFLWVMRRVRLTLSSQEDLVCRA